LIEGPDETIGPVGPFNVASARAVPSRRIGRAVSKGIEDYGLIGDRRSADSVGCDGAIDWLCWPHFDSDACFAALLGDERHGR
jgi:GH15 family glucan-1,4-alpha-glucosidase